MSFIVKLTTVRPNEQVPFYGAYCQQNPDAPGSSAREALDDARDDLGVIRSVTISADKLTAVTTTMWEDKAQHDKFRVDHAANMEAATTARDDYMRIVGITMTLETSTD